MKVEIRQATEKDIEHVAFVHARTWQVAYRGLVPDGFLDAIDPTEWADRYRARDVGSRSTILALDGSEPVGMSSFGLDRQDPRLGEIYALYVLPARQGQGIGRRLLDVAVNSLAPLEVGLWCAAENFRSRRFYERYGFTTDGATRTYDIAGVQLMTVRYILNRPVTR